MPFLSSPRNRLSNIKFAGLALLVSLGAASIGRSLTVPNDGFDPNANGIVNTLQIQPDGKILMGGYFTQLHPYGNSVTGCGYIARLNHDGTVDSSFSPNANGVVRTMLLQPNGKILLGGQFTTIQPTGASTAVSRNYVARLNADGTLDTTFNPNANGVVYAVAYQPNGQVVIGGSFTTVQPNGSPSPVTRNHIARFNTDGTLDTTFDPNADRPVLSLAVEPNGQILIGGGFSTLQPNGASSPTARGCAARVNADGSLDTGFDPEPNGSVSTILIEPSGQIIFGGEFTSVQPNGAANALQCDYLARINVDGTLDTTFIINPLAAVSAVALQTDGRLIIGGTFTSVYPANNLSSAIATYVARINPDGSLDGGFLPSPNQAVNAVAVQPDGNIVLGGYFTGLQASDSATPITRNHIARVTTYGIPDASLAPDSTGTIFTTVPLSNGQILVGGSFLSIGGVTQSYLARLNANGSLDTTFAPLLTGIVQTIAVQSDGKILIGGGFTEVDGIPRGYIARLNPDGSLDGPFNPNANSNVFAIALLSSGQMLVGGQYSALTPNGSTLSYSAPYLTRINADGSLDTTFNPGAGGSVFALSVLSDGRILVGGSFSSFGGAARGNMARLLSTGLIDTADFDPEPNSSVYAIAVQSDGKVLIGGAFTGVLPQTGKIGGTPTTYTDAGGNTVTVPQAGYGAATGIYINHLARINTDGTLDFTFFPDPSADVLGLAIQSDGSVLASGILTSFAQNGATTGTIRNFVGRVSSTGALDTGFNPNPNSLVNSVTVLSSGQILIAGSFTTLQPNGAPNVTYANLVALLNSDGSISPSFTAGAGASLAGQVNILVQLANGQFVAGGSFGPFGGNQGANIARFNPDGTPDNSYNPIIDGPVNAISVLPTGASTLTSTSAAVWLQNNGLVRHTFTEDGNGEVVAVAQQADGKVIIAGQFVGYLGSTQANIVRLNTDGTLDTTFNATTNDLVNVLLVQPDGKILVGGNFTTIWGQSTAYLARLNADGSLDTTFAPQPNLQVLALALQPNGQIIVAGDFTFMEFNTANAKGVNYVARLNADGSLDTTFEPDPAGPVYGVAVLPNGQVMIGGSFPSLTPNLGTTTVYIQNLARINSNGGVDEAFYPDPNGAVDGLVLQSNGQIIVAGAFTSFQQNPNLSGTTSGSAGYITPGTVTNRNYIARVNSDGTIDSFNPNPNGSLTSVALAANGQVYFGGNFSVVEPNYVGDPISRSNICRVNSDGTLDDSFDPSLNGTVNTVAPLADGSVFIGGDFSSVQVGGAFLVGGNFAHVSAAAVANLTLLNSDGTYNSTFAPNPNGPVNAIASQQNGQALIGGSFSNIVGIPASNLARIGLDGSLDSSFSAPTNGPVNAILAQLDGRILVGGAFTSIGGQNVTYLARVSSTGSPDPSFVPSINGTVDSVVELPNGQIVVSGAFTSVGGQPMVGIARLNSDGSLDSSFNANANGAVQAVLLQADGTLYVGGAFTTIGGQPIPYAAHLLSNGAVDSSFDPSPNGVVNTVSTQSDGKVLIGGKFTTAGGLSRVGFARFTAQTPVTQTIAVSPNQSVITWTRGGSAPALSSVVFAESTNGSTWNNVGFGTTTDGSTWQLAGLPSTGSNLFEVRLTGVILSSQYSSGGLVQTEYIVNTLATPYINSVSAVTGTLGTPFAFTVTATATPTTFTATGLPPGLSINSSTGIITGTPTAPGTYTVSVFVANAGGSATSTLTITIATSSGGQGSSASNAANRLVNLSSRSALPGSQVLIGGFVISGTGTKPVLLRAVGPGLGSFGVSGYMATPTLELISSSGTLIDQNTGWGGSSALSAAFAQVGAFALSPTSTDSALLENLSPGSYTVHVYDPTATGGIVLAEIYDASASPLAATQRLINLSARGNVSYSFGPLIGGFVISGSSNKSVLIRGIGPGLTAFGVTDAIPDPVLEVFDQNDNLVAQNNVWTAQISASPYQPSISSGDITSADSSVSAFALSAQNSDTALIVDLPPGAYTFQITSASDANGEALGEVYELP